MKVSILLTSYREPTTVAKAIDSLLDSKYTGFINSIQLIQISPDKETLDAGRIAAGKYLNPDIEYIQLTDPGKGKPAALNIGLKKANGDVVVFTDGDVFFGQNALYRLVAKFEEDTEIGAVTGRPISADPKSTMMGYFGHLFADANHYRRMIDMSSAPLERGKVFVKRHNFFPLSGYIMAVKNNLLDFVLPEDVLVDDAYISYVIFNKDSKLAYEPEATCYIKYPKNIFDYFRQKKRSTGGYVQLWKYGIVSEETKSRSPWHELELIWFPFKYASNLKEFIWSIFLLPIRALLWFQIVWDQKIAHKDFSKVWVRVESTK